MSRCGCGRLCRCLITAGENATVTGSGSRGNPYVISATIPPPTPSVAPAILGSAGSAFTGSGSVTLPASTAGKRLVVMAQNGVAPTQTMALPAGWTLVQSIGYRFGNMNLWTKVADGTEGLSVALTNSSGGGAVEACAWVLDPCELTGRSAESTGFDAPYQAATGALAAANTVLMGGYEQGGVSVFTECVTDYATLTSRFGHAFPAARTYQPAAVLTGLPDSWVAMAVAFESTAATFSTVYTTALTTPVKVIDLGSALEVVIPTLDTSALVVGRLTRVTMTVDVGGNAFGLYKFPKFRVYDGDPSTGRLLTVSRQEGMNNDNTNGNERTWSPTVSFVATGARVCVTLKSINQNGYPELWCARRLMTVEQAQA